MRQQPLGVSGGARLGEPDPVQDRNEFKLAPGSGRRARFGIAGFGQQPGAQRIQPGLIGDPGGIDRVAMAAAMKRDHRLAEIAALRAVLTTAGAGAFLPVGAVVQQQIGKGARPGQPVELGFTIGDRGYIGQIVDKNRCIHWSSQTALTERLASPEDQSASAA